MLSLLAAAEKASNHERAVFLTLLAVGVVAIIVAYLTGGRGDR